MLSVHSLAQIKSVKSSPDRLLNETFTLKVLKNSFYHETNILSVNEWPSQKRGGQSKAAGSWFNTTQDEMISEHSGKNAYLECWQNVVLWSLDFAMQRPANPL